jgi:type VI secretion system activator RovC-like protein
MQQPPHVADSAPNEPFLTGYDMTHLVTYLRLLDGDAEGAAWQEAARIVLSLDVETDLERANRVWASPLARAKWMTEQGYRHLLRGGASH